MGGDVLMPLSTHETLSPIDSEHGAIYSVLARRRPRRGHASYRSPLRAAPFAGRKAADLQNITVEQALSHPTWNMGRKISIDSSTRSR